MKKRRIVLASILKPVDDTRMFEKIGVSLSKVSDYEIFVIGYPTQGAYKNHQSVTQLPLKSFKRISLGRVYASWQIMKIIYKVKPELLVVNTHELLIVGILNRIFFGTRIIYDIRENYWRNILHTKAFPVPFRPFLAALVRLKEKLTAPFFLGFFLAEKTYEKELDFLGNRYVVLENKMAVPDGFKRSIQGEKIRLLFSGTLAESTGVFEAIILAKKLHQVDSKIELVIIGFCALPSTLTEIQKEIAGMPFITLIGGDRLVPHNQILDAIATSDFGIICYPPSHHIENRIPTKLYEYLACRLPIILPNQEPWVEIYKPCQAALEVDFLNIQPTELLDLMASTSFYSSDPVNVTWASEEPRLHKKVSDILA
ncbi:MAG: glycosyltransferase [Cyclobacteriaceae bacterium]